VYQSNWALSWGCEYGRSNETLTARTVPATVAAPEDLLS
jgi:hypothetical protein